MGDASPAPVRFFVVDALDDEARAFYLLFQMLAAPDNPYRLYLHDRELAALLEVPQERS